MNQPKVSIVTSTYNRAHLIGTAIRSVLVQTFADFEMVIVDDGSQDNTREAVEGFGDSRLRYVYKHNAGLAAGRNTAVEHARGEYIAFLDDDDVAYPERLALQIQFMDQHENAGWTTGGYRVVDPAGRLLSELRLWTVYPVLDTRTWLRACPTCPSAVMMRRDWFERVGGFDPLFKLSEDWDLWLRLAYAGCQMEWVPEIVCDYLQHTTNMTRNHNAIRAEFGTFRMLDKFFSQPNLPAEMRELRDAAYANMWLMSAEAGFDANNVDAAIEDVRSALQLDRTLAANRGQRALERLLYYAGSPRVVDPYRYAHILLEHLPDEPFEIGPRRRKLYGEVAAGEFFRAADRREWSAVRGAFIHLVRNDPSWLRNRGVWSIMRTALLHAGTS